MTEVERRHADQFLAYVADLARRLAAPSQVRQDESDETTMAGPKGPREEGYQK